MAIGTGTVSMTAINLELGRSSNAQISLDSAENGSYSAINSCSPSRPSSANSAAMSEWRGYNHSFACCNAPSISVTSSTSSSVTISISYSNCTTMHFESSSNGGGTWGTNSTGCASSYTYSGLASSTSYMFRVRITCTSTGGYSGYSNVVTQSTSAGCPPYGTYLSQFCSGCTLYYRYANGSCDSYDVSQGCTTACGGCCCSPANGTWLGTQQCSGYDLYRNYSDGCNGSYSQVYESNSASCGYQEPINCYIYFGDGSGSWLGRDCDGNLVEGWSCCYGEYLFCGTSISYGGYGDINQFCGTGQCPTPDMPILINPNTWVTAGDLKVGDYVYTKHETTGEWGSYQVTSANPGTNTVSRAVIGGQELKVSSNHKFLTESMGFVALSELWVGAKVQTIDGIAEIESIESIGEMEVVQIEVDQAHTYVIKDVVSHNRKIEQEF
jgi:hypothetical protein